MIRTLLLLIFSFALSASAALKIGVVAPLTGNLNYAGIPLRNALMMAQDETPNFDTKLFIEDTTSSSSGTLLAVRRLINLHHVDVLFTPYTYEANIVAPLAQEEGILHFSNCWNSDIIEANSLSFSSSVSYKNFNDAIVDLLKDKGAKSIVMFWEPLWIEGVDWLKMRCQQEGIEVHDFKFMPSDRDFRTAIMKAKEYNPDFYLPYVTYPACDIMLRQLKEFVGDAQVTGYLDIIKDRSLVEGSTYISEYGPIDGFYNRYQERFNLTAQQTLAANTYTNYKILAQVAQGLPKWDGQEASQKILQIKDFPGLIGSISCSEGGVFISPTYRIEVVDGQRVFLK